MRESPRIRRLRSDLRGLESLRDQSTIFDFSVPGRIQQDAPEAYLVRFRGQGLWKPANSAEVLLREQHEVSIFLGAEYPRLMPELVWRTPAFHPNISASGVVCLGGYGTFWAPSLSLAELCRMLWDMIRYKNYDVESPYNREAAHRARTQAHFPLPVDARPLRDRTAGLGMELPSVLKPPVVGPPVVGPPVVGPPVVGPPVVGPPIVGPPVLGPPGPAPREDSAAIIDAELVEPDGPDILFID